MKCISDGITSKLKEPCDLYDYLCSIHSGRENISLTCSRLKTCGSIEGVVQYLAQYYCSFLNCDILEMIVQKYGVDKGQLEMKYPNLLKVFVAKCSIRDFIKVRIHTE